MPRELDTSKLQNFSPKPRRAVPAVTEVPGETGRAVATPNHHVESPVPQAWPSRETPQEGQFTIRASLNTITRFRQMCKDDRRTYGGMLEILMDSFEGGVDSI